MARDITGFISSILSSPTPAVYAKPVDFSPVSDSFRFDRKMRDEKRGRNQSEKLNRDKMSAAMAADEAQRKAQRENELLKEGGRKSRAASKAAAGEAKLAWEKEKFGLEKSEANKKDEEKLFSELREAEAQQDWARVAAIEADLGRMGFSVGTEEVAGPAGYDPETDAATASPKPSGGEEKRSITAMPEIPGAPPELPPTPEGTGDLQSLTSNRKEYKPVPVDFAGAVANAQESPQSGPPEAPPSGGSTTALEDMKKVQGKANSDLKELAKAMKGGKKLPGALAIPPTPPPSTPADDMKAVSDKASGDIKKLDEDVRRRRVIRKDGKVIYEAPSTDTVGGFQKQKVEETFASLSAAAGDPWEKEAAEIGRRVALGNLGAAPLEEAIKRGQQAYEFETLRRYRKDRVGGMHGGPKGGPALNKTQFQQQSTVYDDISNRYNAMMNHNNYKQMVKSEEGGQMSEQLLNNESGVTDAVALGAIISATEQGRPSDADRNFYLQGQGAIARVKQKYNEATLTGKGVVMDKILRADLYAVAQMNKSAAENKRKRLSEEFVSGVTSSPSLKARYGDDAKLKQEAEAFTIGLTGTGGGTKPEGKADNFKRTPEQEEAKRRYLEMMRKKGR